jgi:hypothetical protein
MKGKAEILKAFTPWSWGQRNTPQGDSGNGKAVRLILFLFSQFLLSAFASTTNYVSVTGNVMQGADRTFTVITNLECATGGLVTNGTPGMWVTTLFIQHPGGGSSGGGQGEFVYQIGTTNVYPLQTCYLLWLRASSTNEFTDAGITLAVNGSEIHQWNDSSGHGYTFTNQTFASSGIFYDTNTWGVPTVRFASGRGNLGNYNGLSNAQPFIIYTVMSLNTTNDGYFFDSSIVLGETYRLRLFQNGPPGSWQGVAMETSPSTGSLYSTNVYSTNGLHLITAIFNGSSSSLRLDGTEVATGNLYSYYPYLYQPELTPAFENDTYVSEMIIDTDVSQVGTIEAYLKARNGL